MHREKKELCCTKCIVSSTFSLIYDLSQEVISYLIKQEWLRCVSIYLWHILCSQTFRYSLILSSSVEFSTLSRIVNVNLFLPTFFTIFKTTIDFFQLGRWKMKLGEVKSSYHHRGFTFVF